MFMLNIIWNLSSQWTVKQEEREKMTKRQIAGFKKMQLLRWINTKEIILRHVIIQLLKWKVKSNTVKWRDRYRMDIHLAGAIPSKYSVLWGQWWWQPETACPLPDQLCDVQFWMLFLEALSRACFSDPSKDCELSKAL